MAKSYMFFEKRKGSDNIIDSCGHISIFVHPDMHYTAYIDWRMLSILFCLMIVVKGSQDNASAYNMLILYYYGSVIYYIFS